MLIFTFLGHFHWLAFGWFRFGFNGSRFRLSLYMLSRRCLVNSLFGLFRLRLRHLRFGRYVTRLFMGWFSRIRFVGCVAGLGVDRLSRISLMRFVAGLVMGGVRRMGFRLMLNRFRLVGNLLFV